QCSYEGVLAVKEYDKPTLPAMSVADFCYGVGGSIVNEPADKSGYTWTNNKNSNNEWPDVSSTAAAGDYSYSYVYTDGNGCKQDGSLAYEVHALPTLTAELTQGGENVTTVCPSDGGALVITATVSNFSNGLTYGFSDGTAKGNTTTLDYECSSADKEVTVSAYHQATSALVCTSSVVVNVDYADAPTLTCVKGEPTKYTITSGCSIDVDFAAPTYTNCMANAEKSFVLQTKQKDGSYKDSTTAQTWDNISHSLAPGSYKAIFTVNDACLGSNKCVREFTVVDGVAPMISCEAKTVSTDAGKCSAEVVLNAPKVGDNCGVSGLKVKIGEEETVVPTDGTHTATFAKGSHTVLWTVIDVNGKSNTCTQTVTVEDKENPVISGISDVTKVSCDGQPVSKTINLTVTDNCAATLTLKVNGGAAQSVAIVNGTASYNGTFPVGATTLTWTAKDEDGNSKEVSQTITVTDGRPSSTALSLDVCDLDKYSKADAETYISAQFSGYTLTMGAASDNAAGTVRTYEFTLAHKASASCTYDGTLTVTEGKPESLLKLEMTVCYIKDNSAEQAKAFIEEKVAGAYTVGNVSTSDGGK
ncbi:MAG: hypothetical protein U0L74_03745, partial [Paludibacteraceae bacterium]|nr:hypothetical protein [Paludibacteraceae bacterium]